jgi:hypothetical protein
MKPEANDQVIASRANLTDETTAAPSNAIARIVHDFRSVPDTAASFRTGRLSGKRRWTTVALNGACEM